MMRFSAIRLRKVFKNYINFFFNLKKFTNQLINFKKLKNLKHDKFRIYRVTNKNSSTFFFLILKLYFFSDGSKSKNEG
jgi:hypothetical protein